MNDLKIVGNSYTNADAIAKVTGKAMFNIDLELPRMLWAKVKRSPHAHARILKIDTSKAEKLPGVKIVITGDDNTAPSRFGTGLSDEYTLAREKVSHIGEPVAAVAAETEEIAEEAVDLIDVEYEELRAVFDGEESIESDPPVVIHEELKTYKRATALPPTLDKERPNVFNVFKVRQGDVGGGFGEADLVVQNRFTTAPVAHCQFERHNALAKLEADGTVTVWGADQGPFKSQKALCEGLGLPLSNLRFIVPSYVGGGFGGRDQKPYAICAALALNQRGNSRPVKFVYTHDEAISNSIVRARYIVDIKTGVKKDGSIIANEIRLILVGGSYTGSGFLTAKNAAYGPCTTYKIANVKLDAYGVYTNQVKSGAFRGFGNCESLWGMESQIDIIACALGMDPVEFRLRNVLEKGDVNAFGEIVHSFGARECLEKVAKGIEWGKLFQRESGVWRKGKGIALGNKYSGAPSASCAVVKINYEGNAIVYTATVDIGHGSNTIFAQIVAEEFGIPIGKIKVINPDTSISPFDATTSSSRATFSMGNAIRMACHEARRQILEQGAKILMANPSELDLKNGEIFLASDNRRKIRIADLFVPLTLSGWALREGGEISGKATFYEPGVKPDPETGQSSRPTLFYMPTAQAAEVEVNVETGQVKVTNFVSAVDVGKAINPMNVEGQILGGALSMGIGTALYEELLMEQGRILNPTFVDYKIPSALEVPSPGNVKAIIVEDPHRQGPFGAKGVGEASLVITAPAISNAIFDATGIRFKDIPITPEKVFWALKGK
jgi:CO/xanthine dehydrogenase Mo-binding subunit